MFFFSSIPASGFLSGLSLSIERETVGLTQLINDEYQFPKPCESNASYVETQIHPLLQYVHSRVSRTLQAILRISGATWETQFDDRHVCFIIMHCTRRMHLVSYAKNENNVKVMALLMQKKVQE